MEHVFLNPIVLPTHAQARKQLCKKLVPQKAVKELHKNNIFTQSGLRLKTSGRTMAFVKALWCKFIKLRFQLWSLRCLLCYLWKIPSICNVQCPMLSNDHETERTKDPLDSSSIEAEIGSQSQKPSKCFHQKSLNQVTIIESASLVVGAIWISLRTSFRENF